MAGATVLRANEPIIPLAFGMGLTFFIALYTAGGALLAVSLIEAMVLRKLLQWSWPESLKLSFLANLFSTGVGLGAAFASASGEFFLIGCVAGAALLTGLMPRLHAGSGRFSAWSGHPWPGGTIAAILLFAVGELAALSQYSSADTLAGFSVRIAGTLLPLIAGFAISVLTEAWLLYRRRPDAGQMLWQAAVTMNLFSYGILLATFAVVLFSGRMPASELFGFGSPRSAQKRTIGDIKTIATAVEIYNTDNSHYPVASNIVDLCKTLVPEYMATCIRHDGWSTYVKPRDLTYLAWDGTPAGCKITVYKNNAVPPIPGSKEDPCGPRHYLIASPGKDGRFEHDDLRNVPERDTSSYNNDIVLRDGLFIEAPSGKQSNAPVK